MDTKERADLVRQIRFELKREHSWMNSPARLRASLQNRDAERAMFGDAAVEDAGARRASRRLRWRRRVGSPWQERAAEQNRVAEEAMFAQERRRPGSAIRR